VQTNVYAGSFLYSSDERLKEGITRMQDGLSNILALSPVSFTLKEDIQNAKAGKEDIGFIAQEVEQVIPGIVHTDDEGMKSVDYIKLVPILVQALQEQQAEIEELKALVKDQERRIQSLDANLTLSAEELPATGTE